MNKNKVIYTDSVNDVQNISEGGVTVDENSSKYSTRKVTYTNAVRGHD